MVAARQPAGRVPAQDWESLVPVMLTVNPTVWSFPIDRPTPSPVGTGETPGSPSPALETWPALRRYLSIGGVERVPVHSEPVTVADAGPVRAALEEDSLRVVAEILAATVAAPSRSEPMLLALALASATDDDLTRRAALTALPRVARTSRDLFLFATFVQGLRGWGRGLRRAVGAWYNDRSPEGLVEDVLTTPAHAGWRHADLLRLGHPKAPTPTHDMIYRWLVTGDLPGATQSDPAEPAAQRLLARLTATTRLAGETSPNQAAALIGAHRLPLANVPEAMRRAPVVWEALVPHLSLPDLLTSLPEMASIGGLDPDAGSLDAVRHRLSDGDAIASERIEPLAVIAALRSYETGHARGKRWAVDQGLVQSLERAFDLACRRVEGPAGRVELTVPAGLGHGRSDPGSPDPLDVAASLAIVLVRSGVEARIVVAGGEGLPLRIGAAAGLDEVAAVIRRSTMAAGEPVVGSCPVTIQSLRPGGLTRVIEIWPTLPSGQSVPAVSDGVDRIAIHGMDTSLIGTVLGLLRW